MVLGVGHGVRSDPPPGAGPLAVGADDQPGPDLRRATVLAHRHTGSDAVLHPHDLGGPQHGGSLRLGPAQQGLLQARVREPDRGPCPDRDVLPAHGVHPLSVLVELDHGERHDSSLVQGLGETGQQRLVVTPRPGQLAPDPVPEPALLLDPSTPRPERARTPPSDDPASPPPAMTTSNVLPAMTLSPDVPRPAPEPTRPGAPASLGSGCPGVSTDRRIVPTAR